MRQPRPWLRKQTGTWYVCIDGEQHSLGKDKAEAHDEFHRLMTERTGVVRTTRLTVREIVTAYLDYVKANRAANTHKKYKHILTTFSASTAATLRPHALRPYHVQQCIDKHYNDRSTTYQADVITSIVAALNWGESMGLVARNPIARMKKPRRNVRENYIPSEKWAELIAAASDDCFRDYLTVALSSGARPNELRTMQASYLNGSRVIFPRLKSKGKTRQRVVYLGSASFLL
ncbi:MAG: hypothetical protein KF853_16060 [Rhodocyclaceae bacterium]|nr:hypothetical protein [Rhodocyclaceae bacterium]